MKKIVTIIALAALTSLSAQGQRPSVEEMQARRAEQTEKQAERLAKDFGLKDQAKADFVATYKAYQAELQGLQQERRLQARPGSEEGKKLTDEEAQKQIDEYFARQERQLTTQQQRLAVEKKYYAELQKTLNARQLVKIFTQRNNNRLANGQRPGGGPQGRPGGGRPSGDGFGGFGEGF